MARARAQPFAPTAVMRVIILHGKEPFLMRERSRAIVELLEEAYGTVEQFTYDGASVELAIVLDELRSYGLMCPHKLVILDRADQFLSGQDTRRRSMETYVQAPVDHATLLMRAETWRPGKIDKLIGAGGMVHKVEPVDDATARAWCVQRCLKRYDTAIDPEAAAMLVARIGPELDRLDTELSKLASYAGPGAKIGPAEVAQMVGLSREQQAWAIQSSVLSGDPARSITMLRELLTISRQPEQLIAWAITDLLRKLYTASQALHSGVPAGTVARELRLWGPERDQILTLAKRHPPTRFAQLLRSAVETDSRTKRGYGRADRSLEALSVLVTDSMGT